MDSKISFICLIITAILIVTSCKTEEAKKTPVLATEQISEITIESALSGGLIVGNGGLSITQQGVCWSTNPSPTTKDSITKDIIDVDFYESHITGLERGTEYYVRAYAINSLGISYGQELTFNTITELPLLATNEVLDISYETAKSGGFISDYGGADIVQRGVCWSINPSPTIDQYKTVDSLGGGRFESEITGLEKGQTYYIRAYAINSQGVGYGDELIFSTKVEQPPLLETVWISEINFESAISGGKITDYGGSEIVKRGVCWSTHPSPTTDDCKTNDGSGVSNFESEITGLERVPKYYVRAYATNSQGTSYGQEIVFLTAYDDGIFVDPRDNVAYKWVKIHKQIWMAENLRATKYVDGSNATYYWYNNDSIANATTYGALYTWYSAMNNSESSTEVSSMVQGVCPSGWHLPSTGEWRELLESLDDENKGSQLAGRADLWWAYNGSDVTTIEDNSNFGASGFSALPGGHGYDEGDFSSLGCLCYYWSTSFTGSDDAYFIGITNMKTDSWIFYTHRLRRFSVRCVRD